jgi:hypothetical protein
MFQIAVDVLVVALALFFFLRAVFWKKEGPNEGQHGKGA